MIETWDGLLGLLRHNDVPCTNLSADTLRRLDEIEAAASGPSAVRPYRAIREVVESRLVTLGVVLPVDVGDLDFGEVTLFWHDFFPYETSDFEGRVLAAVHDASKTVRIGDVPCPVVWNGNQPVVTMPREILQAPPEADVPAWLRQIGCEIRFGKKAVGSVTYERTPRPDELLERAVEALRQPQWRDLQHEWRLLAQTAVWRDDAGRTQTRWCLPVAPISGTVPTDDFVVCTSQQSAYNAARRLLANGLARLARAPSEREMSDRILHIMPAWENLADDVVAALPVRANAPA